MIGIVVVSHSAMLAAGWRWPTSWAARKLLLAAGVDDSFHPIGTTDAIAVMSAIEQRTTAAVYWC